MALTRDSIIDQITVLDDGQVLVRKANRVIDGGAVISKAYHRHIVEPGQSLDEEDSRVRAVCQAVHTESVVRTFAKLHP